jgi:hypothetical protein
MLDIATGQQLLQARRLAAGRAAELLARAAGLPGTLASVARRFLESQTARRLPDGHEEVGPELDGLDDHRLETVLEVLLPGLGTAAVQTWRSIGRGFAGSFGMPMPCRVTDEPAVNLGKQMDWLRTTQRVVLDFPPEITTPEGLAVWAPFLEDPFRQQFLGMLFGTSIEGVGTAAHVGRLLASVIDQGGSAGHNVLDTLRLTVHDRHPATTFAGHVPRAFWRSGNAEAHDLLLDHLVTDRRSDRRRFIVRAAGETSLRHMESLLRRLLAHPDALDVGVFAEIRGWLGLPEGNAPAALMEELVAQLVDAIAARSLGLPLPEVPSDRLLHAWAAMAEDFREALPIIASIMEARESEARIGALVLAFRSDHPAARPLVADALADQDLFIAYVAASFLSGSDQPPPCEGRRERLRRLLDLGRRGLEAGDALGTRIGDEPTRFFERIASSLEQVWTDESLADLGGLSQRSEFRTSRFLPADYRPPDDRSIDLLIDLPRPLDGSQRGVADRPQCFLARAALTPAQWHRWLALQAESTAGVTWEFRRLVRRLEPARMVAVCQLLCGDPRPRVRAAGLRIVAEEVYAGAGDPCLALARTLIRDVRAAQAAHVPPATPATRGPPIDEADPLASLAAMIAARDGVEIPPLSATVRAAFPDLIVTPPWTPRPVVARRFTPACAALFTALADIVAAFFQEHGATLVAIAERIPRGTIVPLDKPPVLDRLPLGHPRLASWCEQLQSLATEWWTGRRTAGADGDGQELARLGTLRHAMFESEIYRGQLESLGIDVTGLVALQVPQGVFGSATPPAGYDPALVADYASLHAAAHCRTVVGLFEHLLDTQGTWRDYAWMLDMAETMCAVTPRDLMTYEQRRAGSIFSHIIPVQDWLRSPATLRDGVMPEEIARRLFLLRRYIDSWRWHDGTSDTFHVCSHAAGGATLGDLLRALLAKPASRWEKDRLPAAIVDSMRASAPDRAREFVAFRDRLATVLVTAETARPDEEPTEWTTLAVTIGYLEGFDRWLQVVEAGAAVGLARLAGDITSRRQTLSRLTAAIHPEPTLDRAAAAARIADLVARKRVTQAHMLQAAFLAPQWLDVVGRAIDWPNLPDDVAWIRSLRLVGFYDDDDGDSDAEAPPDPDATRAAGSRPQERVPEGLDDKRIALLLAAARVIEPPKVIEQMRTFIDILRSRVDRGHLIAQALAAEKPIDPLPLALVPLESGGARLPDLLERWRALQHLRQIAGKARRKRDAIELVDRAVEVLARRAGVGTAERLDWMIKAAAGCELPPAVEAEGCESRVVIAAAGRPAGLFSRHAKALKAAPAALKRQRALKPQLQTLKELQAFFALSCRMATEAMIQQRWHTADERDWLGRHPVVRGMFATLLLTDGGHVGLPTEDGRGLTCCDGTVVPLAPDAGLRVVHPVELVASGELAAWTARLQAAGIAQPFEQVVRRVHLAADHPELDDLPEADPLRGLGFERGRFGVAIRAAGWRGQYHLGEIEERLFHPAGIRATVRLAADRDGATRIRSLVFTDRGGVPLTPAAVPPIVFSETLRDLHAAAESAPAESVAS